MKRRLALLFVAPALALVTALGVGAAPAAASLDAPAARTSVHRDATTTTTTRPAPAPPTGVRAVGDGTQGLTAGAALPVISPGFAASALARMKGDGVNAVALFVWWLAAGPRSDTLAPYQGTPPDSDLDQVIGQARADGLAVSLTPVFYCSGCEGGWRGTMAPSDLGLFFQSYGAFVDHYAALAQADGVSTFYVGSELTSLESQTARWRSVIAGVRRHFHGTLAYEENWDVIGHAQFLPAVDEIGVSAYFPLDDQAAPNLTRLLSDWNTSQSSAAPGRHWVAELSALAARTGRPIVFGEAGYMSGDYAARQPFLEFQGQADWQLQADLYQALLQTFSAHSWWRGVDWWEWYPASGSAADDSRTPVGKTAETMLADWYGKGWRPVSADDALAALASGRAASSAASAHAARIESAAVPASVTVPGVMAPDRPMVLAGGAAIVGAVDLPGLPGPGRPADYRGGLAGSTELGLFGLAGLVMLLAAAVWFSLGRRSDGAVPPPTRPG